MSNLSFLENFASETPSAATGSQDGGATSNELRLSFDDGYKCGWQDGSTAIENKDREVQDALSSALQAMNFTYFEARQHAMQSVRPVLEAMLDAVLPQLLSKSLGGRVVEILGEAADTIETSVTITCAPESEKLLRDLVADVIKFPVIVEAEPTLTASQAILHLNEGQTSIDLDATLEAVRGCINTFFDVPEEKDYAHA